MDTLAWKIVNIPIMNPLFPDTQVRQMQQTKEIQRIQSHINNGCIIFLLNA